MKYTNIFKNVTVTVAAILLVGTVHAEAMPAPEVTVLTDAQVFGLLTTANNGEISAAQVGEARASKPEVKEFAMKMISDHTANNQQIEAVEMKTRIASAESDSSRMLKRNADAMVASLKNERLPDFDKVYITDQVNMHQQLLTNLDSNLIPNARNADVKAYLIETRQAVESHLNMAKQIQMGLKDME